MVILMLQGERWTPAKKRRQMLLLSQAMAESRSSHNSSVLALRSRKRELLVRLNGLRGRLADVQRQLGVTGMWGCDAVALSRSGGVQFGGQCVWGCW